MGLLGNLFNFISYRNIHIDGCTLHCRKESGYLIIEGIIPDTDDSSISIPSIISRSPVALNLDLNQFQFQCHDLILNQGIKYYSASSLLDADEVHLPSTINIKEDAFIQLFDQSRTEVYIDEGHQTYSTILSNKALPAIVTTQNRLVYQTCDDSHEWTIPNGIKDVSVDLLQTRKNVSTLNIPESYNFIVGGIIYSNRAITTLIDSFPNLKELNISPDNPHLGYENNVLYSKDSGIAIRVWLDDEKNLELPEGIRGISRDLIDSIKEIRTLTLPSSYEFFIDEKKCTPAEISDFVRGFHNLEELIIDEDNHTYQCDDDNILYDNVLDTVIWEEVDNDNYLYLPDGTRNITSNLVNSREDVERLRIPSTYFFSIDGSICTHEEIAEFIESFPNLKSLEIDRGNPVYAWESNVLYDKVTGIGIYSITDENNSLTIPEGVRYMDTILLKEVTGKLSLPASFEYNLPECSEKDSLDKKAYKYLSRTNCRYYNITNSSRLRSEHGFLIDVERHSASGLFSSDVEKLSFPSDVRYFSIMNTRQKEKTKCIEFPYDFRFLSMGDNSTDPYEGLLEFLNAYPNLESVIIPEDNSYLFTLDNLIIDKTEDKVIYVIDKTTRRIDIPEGVSSLRPEAFSNLYNLETISFPDTFDFTTLYMRMEDATAEIRGFLNMIPSSPTLILPENPIIEMKDSCLLNIRTGEIITIFAEDILRIPEGIEYIDLEGIKNTENIKELMIPSSLISLVEHNEDIHRSNKEKAWFYASSEAALLDDFISLTRITVDERNKHYRIRNNSLVRKFTFSNGDVFHAYLKILDPKNAIIRIPDINTFIACNTEKIPLKKITFDGSEGLMQKFIENSENYHADEILIPIEGFNAMYGQFSKQMAENHIRPYDAFGIVPIQFYGELPYKQSGRYLGPDHFMRDEYEDLNPDDEVRIHISKIIVVLQTFPCISKNHDMIPVTAIIGVRRNYDSYPKELKVPCYYCRDCNRFFIYKENYYQKIKPLIESTGTQVFNQFFYKGFYRGYDYTERSTFKETSILKDAGYEVNALSHLTEKERLGILVFLWESGVESHVIISYIDNFIHFNGGVRNRDMSIAISKWRTDLFNFQEYIKTHRRQRYIKPSDKSNKKPLHPSSKV